MAKLTESSCSKGEGKATQTSKCLVDVEWCDDTKTKTMSSKAFLSSQPLGFPEGRKGVGDPSCSFPRLGAKTVRTPNKPIKNVSSLWQCEHLERNSLSLWRNKKWDFLDPVSLWWTHQVLQSYLRITWLDFSPWTERDDVLCYEKQLKASYVRFLQGYNWCFQSFQALRESKNMPQIQCPSHALPQLLSTKRFWKECWPEPGAEPWGLRW